MERLRAISPDQLSGAGIPSLLGFLGDTGTGKTTLLREVVRSWASSGRPAVVFDSSCNFRAMPGVDVTELPWHSEGDNKNASAFALRSVSPSSDLLLVMDDPVMLTADDDLSLLADRVVASVRAAGGRVVIATTDPACLITLGATDAVVLFRMHHDDERLGALKIPDSMLQTLKRARIGEGIPYGVPLGS